MQLMAILCFSFNTWTVDELLCCCVKKQTCLSLPQTSVRLFTQGWAKLALLLLLLPTREVDPLRSAFNQTFIYTHRDRERTKIMTQKGEDERGKKRKNCSSRYVYTTTRKERARERERQRTRKRDRDWKPILVCLTAGYQPVWWACC